MATERRAAKVKKQHKEDEQLHALKIPPHSIEAEQAVLGSLMLDNEHWDTVSELISEKDFYSRHHRLIFAEMQTLMAQNTPIDLITLSESLERKSLLNDIGGFAYLAELSRNTPSATNVRAYADIIRQRGVLRDLISVANEIADASYSPE